MRNIAEDFAIIEDHFVFKFIIGHLPTCSPDIFGDFELIQVIGEFRLEVKCLVCGDSEFLRFLDDNDIRY